MPIYVNIKIIYSYGDPEDSRQTQFFSRQTCILTWETNFSHGKPIFSQKDCFLYLCQFEDKMGVREGGFMK